MSTITIAKEIYQFLASAIDPKHKSNHMRYVLVTDANMWIATDGFRMHIYPTDETGHEPGYYACGSEKSKHMTTLYRVEDKEVGKEGFYLIKSLYYPGIMGEAQNEKPLMIYEAWNDRLSPINADHFPRVKAGTNMFFRKGIVEKEERAICLGINALPLVWGERGAVEIGDLENGIRLDSRYVLEALSSSIVHPSMRFADCKHPAIIGHSDSAHAVIMPVLVRR